MQIKTIAKLLTILLAIVFSNCSNHNNAKYQNLMNVFEKGDSQEIAKVLWQPQSNTVAYSSVAYNLIQKLKKPAETSLKLSLIETHSNANYTLLIFYLPWSKEEQPYYPVIIENKSNTIVGIFLPFDELDPALTKNEYKQISDIGTKWLKFIISKKFGKIYSN